MKHYCPDCQEQLKPITPEYTGSATTRLRCPECGVVYRVITPNSATQNERLERETVSLVNRSVASG